MVETVDTLIENKHAAVKTMTEVYERSLEKMSPRQMRNHLRRKARQNGSMIDAAFAIILSTIFENEEYAGLR